MAEQPTTELCKWLREHSSGVYRKSAEAADVIESLEQQLAELREALQEIAVAGYQPNLWPSRRAQHALNQTSGEG